MPTVLVVDDMQIFREPIAASLRLAGYETLLAGSGAEAMQLVHARKPDLIVLDVAMPNRDGLSVLQTLRRDANHAWTPVILLTAVADASVFDLAYRLGVRQILLKSQFSLLDLLDRVEMALAADPLPPIIDPAALDERSGISKTIAAKVPIMTF